MNQKSPLTYAAQTTHPLDIDYNYINGLRMHINNVQSWYKILELLYNYASIIIISL